jgi:hypothetical protein
MVTGGKEGEEGRMREEGERRRRERRKNPLPSPLSTNYCSPE